MIAIKNFGWRLGNQMFQIANLIAYARKNQEKIIFPHWKYKDMFNCGFTETQERFNQGKIWTEPGFNYKEIPPGINVLDGYYQSEKYFIESCNYIRQIFSFTKEIQNRVKAINEEILSSECPKVSIHLRRGDYLNYPDHHPVLDMTYFSQAILKFPTNSIFLVFSDDPDWCQTIFQGGKFNIIRGQNDYEDLCLMSMCDHNCIANSSFSWWGAWLNPNPKKIVVAPEKWFGKAYSHFITDDIYCPGWHRI